MKALWPPRRGEGTLPYAPMKGGIHLSLIHISEPTRPY